MVVATIPISIAPRTFQMLRPAISNSPSSASAAPGAVSGPSATSVAGLATTIFFYMAINLMMVMGLAPVVGIPLPLVSFGGSAQMTVLISLGVLMGIDRSTAARPRW